MRLLNLSLIFIFHNIAFSQFVSLNRDQGAGKFKDRNMFVWDFYNGNDSKDAVTKIITECTEEVLVELGYTCLVRREYNDISRLSEMEKSISSVKDIPVEIQNNLILKSAKVVVLGKGVETDINGNTIVRITFDDLNTKERLIAKTITFPEGSVFVIDKRKKILKAELMDMLGIKDSSPTSIKPRNNSVIEEQMWTATIKNPTEAQINEYIGAFPNGKYINEARSLMMRLNKCKNISITILPGTGNMPNGKKMNEYTLRINELKINDPNKKSTKTRSNSRTSRQPYSSTRNTGYRSINSGELPLKIDLEACSFEYEIRFILTPKFKPDYQNPSQSTTFEKPFWGIAKGGYNLETNESFFLNLTGSETWANEVIGILEKK